MWKRLQVAGRNESLFRDRLLSELARYLRDAHVPRVVHSNESLEFFGMIFRAFIFIGGAVNLINHGEIKIDPMNHMLSYRLRFSHLTLYLTSLFGLIFVALLAAPAVGRVPEWKHLWIVPFLYILLLAYLRLYARICFTRLLHQAIKEADKAF